MLVTGGTGSFGNAFVEELLDRPRARRGARLLAATSSSSASSQRALDDDPRVRFFLGDVRDVERLTHGLPRAST